MTASLQLPATVHLPIGVAVVTPILVATGAAQARGVDAILSDPQTLFLGLFIASGSTWTCWQAGTAALDTAPDIVVTSGSEMPAVLVRALADQARIVTGNVALLTGLLGRVGWPQPATLCELPAVLRAMNQPADTVGMAVHLLGQPIVAARTALADHRWRQPTGAGDHAWITARVQAQVVTRLDGLLGFERASWLVHERINRYGVLVDRALARRCIALAKLVRQAVIRQASAQGVVGCSERNLGNATWLGDCLRGLGVAVADDSVPMLEMALVRLPPDHPRREMVQWLLSAAIIVRQTEATKFGVIVAHLGTDDILRGAYVFCGAFPGRWTSRGAQLQNIKRSILPALVTEALIGIALTQTTDTDAAVAARLVAAAGAAHAHACLGGLIRPCFLARPGTCFAICDLSLIELRILNWLAGDAEVLVQLADPSHDAHRATAEAIWREPLPKAHPEYHLRRDLVAKPVNHGFGFGLSSEGAEKQARQKWGLDLAALGLTGEQLRAAYHRRFPLVERLWKRLFHGALTAVQTGRAVQVGRVTMRMGVWGLAVILPSGRLLVYPGAKLARNRFGGDGISFQNYGDNGQVETRELWGSKMAQHLCEGIGRDLLIGMMAAMHATGYTVPMHTHDDLLVEVPEVDAERHLAEVRRIMSTSPPWAPDLPLAASGHLSRRFSKGSLFMA